jgi:Mg2+ and Co2+ transporter CorA
MEARCYLLAEGRLSERPLPDTTSLVEVAAAADGAWVDVVSAGASELESLLKPLDLHPLQLRRCTDAAEDPGMVTFGDCLLVEYPAFQEGEDESAGFLTVLLKAPLLVTVRHGQIPALDELGRNLLLVEAPPLLHLAQLLYMIIDEVADLTVAGQIALRDDIRRTARVMAESPAAVAAGELAGLRARAEVLVSLVENQLYCVTGLRASDHPALQEPHRKAYVEDLVAEAEIAQRSLYRLEVRVGNLFSDYQAAGSDRIERRLRLLTVISAITLPLGLIAGLLGMNVGGLPGTGFGGGFGIVVGVMAAITLGEFWFFKRSGWFS